MKSILIFMSITKSITIRVDENRREYMLFRIHVYLFEHKLAVEVDEKKNVDRDPIFEKKRQEALEKELNCEFISINTSKGYERLWNW